MRCAFTAAILAAAFSSGCSTVSKTHTVATEIARVPAAELQGLSRPELEARLNLKPATRQTVIEARLEGEEVVTREGGLWLASGTQCQGGRRPTLMLEDSGIQYYPEFEFRSGRVAAVRRAPTRVQGVPGAQEIVVTCIELKQSAGDQARSAGGIAIAAPLMAPFGAAIALTKSATAKDLNAPLSKLALGREPPGGLEAYLGKLPDAAELRTRDGANAQVGFRFFASEKNKASQPDIRVDFVDGKVAKLLSSESCVLTEDRTFSCERASP